MGRRLPSYTSFPCAEPGCTEHGRYEYTSRKDYDRIYKTYGINWRCHRHTNKSSWLTPEHLSNEVTLTVDERPYGRFWTGIENGYAHGTGFNAYADEFPPGTKLIVSVRVELPAPRQSDGRPKEVT